MKKKYSSRKECTEDFQEFRITAVSFGSFILLPLFLLRRSLMAARIIFLSSKSFDSSSCENENTDQQWEAVPHKKPKWQGSIYACGSHIALCNIQTGLWLFQIYPNITVVIYGRHTNVLHKWTCSIHYKVGLLNLGCGVPFCQGVLHPQ